MQEVALFPLPLRDTPAGKVQTSDALAKMELRAAQVAQKRQYDAQVHPH